VSLAPRWQSGALPPGFAAEAAADDTEVSYSKDAIVHPAAATVGKARIHDVDARMLMRRRRP